MNNNIKNNFPSTDLIFQENSKIFNKKRINKQLSAISRAELFGGFQPTIDEIAESSSNLKNPFESTNTMYSNENNSKKSENRKKIEKYDYYQDYDNFNHKSQEISRFITYETKRILENDPQEFLSASLRKEINELGSSLSKVKRKLFNLGLI